MSGCYKFGNNSLIKNPFQIFFRSYDFRMMIGASEASGHDLDDDDDASTGRGTWSSGYMFYY